MPRIDPVPQHGRIPKELKLRKIVRNLLERGSDAVIALTDVYTGTGDFDDAIDAKAKMSKWVGPEERFFPHAAQHDFEAWLLPYWFEIQKLAGHKRAQPPGMPEQVNHNKPPSRHIQALFEAGSNGRSYIKTRDASRILKDQNLEIAARQCPELKSFINTILHLCGAVPLP